MILKRILHYCTKKYLLHSGLPLPKVTQKEKRLCHLAEKEKPLPAFIAQI